MFKKRIAQHIIVKDDGSFRVDFAKIDKNLLKKSLERIKGSSINIREMEKRRVQELREEMNELTKNVKPVHSPAKVLEMSEKEAREYIASLDKDQKLLLLFKTIDSVHDILHDLEEALSNDH